MSLPDTPWRGGIIAAGLGERLRAGGWTGSKAMLPVAGRPLIDHALDRFAAAGVDRVCVLLNDSSPDARAHLRRRAGIDLVVRSTPSSFASFMLMAARLGDGPAAVTTVDAIMPDDVLRAFLGAAAALPHGALALGVTTHVDDEKPLWATLTAGDRVVDLGAAAGSHVTAGLYAWTGPLPRTGGHDRLRDYLRALVLAGYPVFGVALPTVLDVDRFADVTAAERIMGNGRGWTLDAGAGDLSRAASLARPGR